MALVARQNIACLANQDGSLDTGFPLGNKNPTISALLWNNVGLLAFATLVANRATGAGAFSSDVRQYLSGTNSATATLSVVTVSGTDVTVNGWGVSGSNVTNAGTNAGSGVFKIGANDGTGTAFSDPIPWLYVAPVTDTLAPCMPTGPECISGQNSVTFSVDIPGDAHDGTNPGAIARVELLVNGAVVDHVDVAAGLSPASTLINFGSSTPSPSFIQTGNSWALSGGGAGTHSTVESFPYGYFQVTGDFRMTCRLASFNPTVDAFSSCGLMLRENITGLDRMIEFYKQASDNSLQVKLRAAQAGIASNQNVPAANSAPAIPWLQIQRAGSTVSTRQSSDGGAWTEFLSSSFTLPPTAYAGKFICSKVNGTAVNAVMDQFWISSAGRATFAPITTSVAKTVTFRAKDVAGNYSIESPPFTGTPVAPTLFKRWHPGHGIRNGDNQSITSGNLSQLGSNARFGFVDCVLGWGQVETTLNTYNWALVETNINACLSKSKRIFLKFEYKRFNTTNTSGLGPTDLINTNRYVSVAPQGGQGNVLVMKVWEPDVMDRLIAFHQLVAERYDDNVTVEGIYTSESSSGLATPFPSGFTRSIYATQLKRLYAAIGIAFVHTPAYAQINYTSGEVAGLVQSAYQNKLGMADADSISTTGNTVFTGAGTDNASIPAFDYRGKMPRLTIASTVALTVGNGHYNGPASNIINFMQTGGTTHCLWVTFVTSSGSTLADINAAIDADPNLATSCPVIYNSTCQA